MSNVLQSSSALQTASLASAPDSSHAGTMYYDSTLGKFRFSDGSAFQNLATEAYVNAAISGATFANTSLSNLSATAISADLIPAVNLGINLGSATLAINNAYINSLNDSSDIPSSSPLARLMYDASGATKLDWNTNLILVGTINRAADNLGSNQVEEEYVNSTLLLASQTNVTIFTLPFATYGYFMMDYKFETASGEIQGGRFLAIVSADGSKVEFDDLSIDSTSTGISFDAVVSGSDMIIRYTSGADAATLRADVKRIVQ